MAAAAAGAVAAGVAVAAGAVVVAAARGGCGMQVCAGDILDPAGLSACPGRSLRAVRAKSCPERGVAFCASGTGPKTRLARFPRASLQSQLARNEGARMPDYQNPRAKALQEEALQLRDRATTSKSESERAYFHRQADEKEREADRIEDITR